MKPTNKIERLVKKNRYKASAETYDKTLHGFMQAVDNYKKRKSTLTKPSIWLAVARSRISQIAAVAVIIIATSFFFIQQEQSGEVQTQQITKTVKSPAELLTMGSLNLAHRHGGMEAVEKQSLKALGTIAVANSNIKQLQIEYFENNGI